MNFHWNLKQHWQKQWLPHHQHCQIKSLDPQHLHLSSILSLTILINCWMIWRGKGSIHTAHGIMLQEVSDKTVDLPDKQDLPSLPRSKRRSLSLTHEPSLPDCYISLRRNPPCNNDHLEHHGGKQAINDSMKMNILWVMLRMLGVSEAKPVPGWTGFLSSTERSPLRLTAIDYYPVINHPITEYKTVQECLRVAKEVGQGYVITTFDLGVCMKAFPLMWQNPEKYRDHVILIGTFHLECAFMKILGKIMKGSGLSDIIIEAGLISSGSVAGVMQGKHYDRAVHCNKVVLEALESLLVTELFPAQEHPLMLCQMRHARRLMPYFNIHLVLVSLKS